MSGVYIQGMKMPESCADCRFCGEYCYAKGDENKYSKLPCPLAPVPPHGRLGDLDAIMTKLNETSKRVFGNDSVSECSSLSIVADYIEEAPTVIPASCDEPCKSRKLSNGDKIRTKNNYNLADWLTQIIDCCWNAGRWGECDEDCPMYNCCNNQSSDNIEDWLKQEAQE